MLIRAEMIALVAIVSPVASQSLPHVYRVDGVDAAGQLGFAACGGGDIDHDGRPDLVAGAIYGLDSSGVATGSVSAYSSANGALLWTAAGEGFGDRFGWAVAPVGDFDADGWPDVAAGGHKNDAGGIDAGMVRVLSGRDGSTLRTFLGLSANDFFGHCVAGVGDVTGDGVPDLGVGAWQAEPAGDSSGSAYVISGADGSVVWRFDGTASNHRVGFSIWSAGDVDGDGLDDVIVGATGQTSVWVLSGVDGSVVHRLQGETLGDSFGYSVRSADDVDGDSVPDIMVGALKANGFRGYARVYSGATGALLHHVIGDGQTDLYGTSIVGFGDVDGDGYGEFAVGGFLNGGNGHESGFTRIYSGRSGAVLATLYGNSGGDWFGYALAKVGDVDLDGVPDLAIGANQDDPGSSNAGTVGVYSGALFGTGQSFCAGDGSASACPCGNASPSGWIQGCRNSTGVGGMLRASGTASVSSDTAFLEASGLPESAATLFFQGTSSTNSGAPFGDGVRCVGGALVRLGLRDCLHGHLQWPRSGGIPLSTLGEIATHGFGTRYYQAFYRNVSGTCGAGFNVTNGVSLTWTP